MGGGIYAAGHAGEDDQTAAGEVAGEEFCHPGAVGGGRAGAYDGYARTGEDCGVAPDPEDCGGIVDLEEAWGVGGVIRGEDGCAGVCDELPLLLGGGSGAAVRDEVDGLGGQGGRDSSSVRAREKMRKTWPPRAAAARWMRGGAEARGESEGEPGEAGFVVDVRDGGRRERETPWVAPGSVMGSIVRRGLV